MAFFRAVFAVASLIPTGRVLAQLLTAIVHARKGAVHKKVTHHGNVG
jgi:hypothetical protein